MCENINSVMEKIQWLTQYVLVTGTLQDPGQAFLVLDKTVINEIHPFEDIPLVLLLAFFVCGWRVPTPILSV